MHGDSLEFGVSRVAEELRVESSKLKRKTKDNAEAQIAH
jgi:hypothetical protein